jgi:asparaginyl-tRNA synthetase
VKDTRVKDLYRKTSEYAGKQVKVRGWVRKNRSSNEFGFIELNDGSFFKNIQLVYESSKLDNYEDIAKLKVASAVTAEGILVETPKAKQAFEIKVDKIIIDAESDPSYPLQKKRHTMEFMRDIAHLRARSNTFSAVFRVRSMLAYAIHKFFQERGFVYVNTPIITSSDAEGAGEMFQVTTLDIKKLPENENGSIDYRKDFFEKKTALTVSGQLEAEAFALAFGRVYTFGPTFRAENSNTARHASEFWMIEPEIAYADLSDLLDIEEEMLKYIISYVIEEAPEEMEFFNSFIDKGLMDRLENICTSEFARITYTEAVELLKKSGQEFKYPVEWGVDLQTEHERYITEKVYKKPVFVTDYPKDIKAFYMRMNDDGKTVAGADLLVPGIGEICGGSQREERTDMLRKRMEELGLSEEEYAWYLELRRYGGVYHSGFGLGFERAVMYITGMSNIRDVIPFPRTPRNAKF